jgi:hypothetical protein
MPRSIAFSPSGCFCIIFAIYISVTTRRIPLPPELRLVGDLLAYIDIFSVLFLLGILSRVTTVLFLLKQIIARVAGLTSSLITQAQWLDFRHRRERGTRSRRCLTGRPRNDDDEPVFISGFAWASRLNRREAANAVNLLPLSAA